MKAQDLAFIPLLAPKSDAAREDSAFSTASGFVYYVSMTGVTGAAGVSMEDATSRANALRDRVKLPVVVGFGIDSKEKARIARDRGVSGIAVGTAIVKAIAAGQDRAERTAAVSKLIRELRAGLSP